MTERERKIAARAIWQFAIWHNGELCVGSPEKPYKIIYEKILSGKMDNELEVD